MTAADAPELTSAQRLGKELLAARVLVASPVDAFFGLHPGDRPLVKAGEAVGRGQPLIEHYRDPRTIVLATDLGTDGPAAPGERWAELPGRRASEPDPSPSGELLFRSGGKWRIAGGDRPDPIEAPFAGITHEVRPGIGVTVRTAARGIVGRMVLAGPDVGPAPGRDRRGRRASGAARRRERSRGDHRRRRADRCGGAHAGARRGRARGDRRRPGHQGAARFPGVGTARPRRRPRPAAVRDPRARRRLAPPIASPLMAMFKALEGGMVAIVGSPPLLVIDDATVDLPVPAADLVRVRSGPLVGAEGTWAGLAGPRRFPAGVTLEAALVGSVAGRRSRSRSATSSALPDGRVTTDLDSALVLESGSPEATRAFAANLAAVAAPGTSSACGATLGAGKTVFAKGFGGGLGVRDTILSPSFVLMGEYAGRLPLFHIDLYRLATATEALDGGLLDDRQATGVVLIEWPDRLGAALPDDRLDVRIEGGADEPRSLRLTAHGKAHRRYLAAALAAGAEPAP
jgi:tRNA threonylcarbamoyladenosine biosynthesis protein TsaE